MTRLRDVGHVERVLRRNGFSSGAFVKKLEEIEGRDGWTRAPARTASDHDLRRNEWHVAQPPLDPAVGRRWARDGAREVCELLLEVDDFKRWAGNMKRKARTRQRTRHK